MQKLNLQESFESFFYNKYSFQSFLDKDIAKSTTVKRKYNKTVYKPEYKLKRIQRFLNVKIISYFKVNNRVVFSYRQGVNAFDAVEKHLGNKHYLKSDIKSFFPSITENVVRELFLKHVSDTAIIDQDIIKYLSVLLKYIIFDDQLPVGYATSPQISNALLYEFDCELESYCNEHQVTYSRYSDDVIFSANNIKVLEGIVPKINTLLMKYFHGIFCLNDKKTHLFRAYDRIQILGLIVRPDAAITINKILKAKIETTLFYYLKDSSIFHELIEKNFSGRMNKFSGSLNYIQLIDPDYILKLRKKYGNYSIDKFLHRKLHE